jgi:hypothetical protein
MPHWFWSSYFGSSPTCCQYIVVPKMEQAESCSVQGITTPPVDKRSHDPQDDEDGNECRNELVSIPDSDRNRNLGVWIRGCCHIFFPIWIHFHLSQSSIQNKWIPKCLQLFYNWYLNVCKTWSLMLFKNKLSNLLFHKPFYTSNLHAFLWSRLS